ncbi:gamma-secretase-activating protein [Anaeramoeba flamelloides]|uniref:Gamma-secretase-activating protein n=1 Tax=Anaeramoeba flamelloides TaxID=1746091 RepID=A0ABQ8X496_9EUKA|nr:gamma-secretase-activating protein [Anaeramoeba flamelloides]
MLNIEFFFSSKSLIASTRTNPKTLKIVGIGYNGTLLISKRVQKIKQEKTNDPNSNSKTRTINQNNKKTKKETKTKTKNQKQEKTKNEKTKNEKPKKPKNKKIFFEELYLISYSNRNPISSSKPLWTSKENEIILVASLSCDQSLLIVNTSQKISLKKHKNKSDRTKRHESFVINLKTGESSSILCANQYISKNITFLPIRKELLRSKKKKKEIIKNFHLLSIDRKKKIQILALKISTNSLFNKKRWKTTIRQKKELFQNHVYSQFIAKQQLLWVITSDLNLYFYLHVFKFIGNRFKLQFKILVPQSFVKKCLYKKKLTVKQNTKLPSKQMHTLNHYNSSQEILQKKSKADLIMKKKKLPKTKSCNTMMKKRLNKKNPEENATVNNNGNQKKRENSNDSKQETKGIKREEGEGGEINNHYIDSNPNSNGNTNDSNTNTTTTTTNNNNNDNDNNNNNNNNNDDDDDDDNNNNNMNNNNNSGSDRRNDNSNITNTNTNKKKNNVNRNNNSKSKNDKQNHKNDGDHCNKNKNKNNSRNKEKKNIIPTLNILTPFNDLIKNQIISLFYNIKGNIYLIKLSKEIHCLCHQENLIKNKSRNIIVTIFIIEKQETLVLKIPISEISKDNFKKIRIFFTKIPKNLLLIWIPKYYFHLIDCSPQHLTCTSFRFERDSAFVSTLPDINNDEADDDDDDGDDDNEDEEEGSKCGNNNKSKSEENCLDYPNLITIPTDNCSLFLDKCTGYVYSYRLEIQSLLSILKLPIGAKYSKLIIHYLLSHLGSEKLDNETKENYQNFIYHFLISKASHNLNKQFFKEFLISAPFQLIIQQKKFQNVFISKILPSTTIKKFKTVKKKKKCKGKKKKDNTKNDIKTKSNMKKNDHSNCKSECFTKINLNFDNEVEVDTKCVKIGGGCDYDDDDDLCIAINSEKECDDDESCNDGDIQNFNYAKNLVEISKNNISSEKKQLINQIKVFSFKDIWKNYHQKQAIQLHLDKYLSGKGDTEIEKQRKQLIYNNKTNQNIFLEILTDKINSCWQGKRKEFTANLTNRYNYFRKKELHKLWDLMKSNIIKSLDNEKKYEKKNEKDNDNDNNDDGDDDDDNDNNINNNEKKKNKNKIPNKSKSDSISKNNNNNCKCNSNRNRNNIKEIKMWFQILLNLSSTFEKLFFDPPKDFDYYFLRLSYKSLKKNEFCCYLNQNILEIDQEFVQELIDNKKENSQFISKCITHLKNQKLSLKYLMKNCKEKTLLLQYLSSKHYQVYQNWKTSFPCNYDNFFAPYEINFKVFNDSFSQLSLNKEQIFILQNFDAFLPEKIL